MDAEQHEPVEVVQRTNSMGTAGFVVSLAGLLTCGLICPVGFILSLIGLGKQPKGLAIAGSIIGGIGSLFGVLFGLGIVWTLLTAGEFAETGSIMDQAADRIENARTEAGAVPSEEEGTALVADLRDGWGGALRYETTTDGYVITSAGFDGEFDTADDLKRTWSP